MSSIFPLKRYFTLVAAGSIAVAALMIGWLDYRLSVEEHGRFAEIRNETFARVLIHSIFHMQPELFGGEPLDHLDKVSQHSLETEINGLIGGSEITKVRVYDRLGNITYSTLSEEIGLNRVIHEPFATALSGHTGSEIEFGGLAIQGAGSQIESYMPVRARPDGEVVAVLEVYSNLDSLREVLQRNSIRLSAAIGAIMLLLFAVLFVFVRRASQVIDTQHGLVDRYVSELKIAVRRSESANRAKSQFVANMSHEIRTPLHALIGVTDLLSGTELSSRQRAHVNTLRNSADLLMSLVDDVLDFSRLEAGALELDDEPFRPAEIIDGLLDVMQINAAAKGLELAAGITPGADLELRGDSRRLSQVLLNLVGNAIKFTDTGYVIISADAERQPDQRIELRLSVEDSGMGISADQRERLFNPFVQGDASATRRHGGAGLGLAICKQLAEVMGGGISVDAAGSGSCFTVTIPFECSDDSPTLQVDALRHSTTLLVGMQPRILQLLADHSGLWGMESLRANTWEEAERWVRGAADAGAPLDYWIGEVSEDDPDARRMLQRLVDEPRLQPRHILLYVESRGMDRLLASLHGLGLNNVTCLPKPIMSLRLAQALSPATRPRQSNGPASAEPQARSERGNNRVLVAEDVAVSRIMLVEMLGELGYEAVCASDGGETLDMLGRETYDCVLLDCQMPVMDGYDVAIHLRSAPGPNRNTTVIAVTANATREDRERCLACGMDDYISKPIKLERLRQVLGKWLPQRDRAAGAPGGD